jgi:hypothetical protein
MTKLLVLGIVLLGAAATASAGECPALQAQIDEEFGRRFDGQASRVRQIAKEADGLHKAGKHADSVKKYDEAAKAGGLNLTQK